MEIQPPKYLKDGDVFEALQWTGQMSVSGTTIVSWVTRHYRTAKMDRARWRITVETSNGLVYLKPGSWVVMNAAGDFFVCDPFSFAKDYSPTFS